MLHKYTQAIVIISIILSIIILLIGGLVLLVCIYRRCLDKWRKKHEYDLSSQYETYTQREDEEDRPPEYHNLSFSTGLIADGHRQNSRRNRRETNNYQSMERSNSTGNDITIPSAQPDTTNNTTTIVQPNSTVGGPTIEFNAEVDRQPATAVGTTGRRTTLLDNARRGTANNEGTQNLLGGQESSSSEEEGEG